MGSWHAPAAVVWKSCGFAFAAVALGFVVFALVGTRKGIAYFYHGKYVTYLSGRMRSLHIFSPPSRVVFGQVAALFVVAIVLAVTRVPHVAGAAVVVLVGPAIYLERALKKRVERLDFQADGFATALANALKSTPSIGAALLNVVGMLDGPVAQELSLALKELRLGKSLEEALLAIGPRARSPKIATVLASILIGRQVGGNLTRVLETTAATLREMDRLEGVVRQKTADTRSQMWAMTLAPFLICYSFIQFDENYFEPLTATPVGYALSGFACVSYIVSLVVARKILAVDI